MIYDITDGSKVRKGEVAVEYLQNVSPASNFSVYSKTHAPLKNWIFSKYNKIGNT